MCQDAKAFTSVEIPFNFDDMHEPEQIWRFGRWIARRLSGVVRLAWSTGSMEFRLRRGQIVSLTGPDPSLVARSLGCAPVGETDLLDEAVALSGDGTISETQALGVVKEIFQAALSDWFVDDERTAELTEEEPEDGDRPTISVTHAVIELLLSDTEGTLDGRILPDRHLLLRRAPNFLELYAPLRLSEEADLVVAKITGQRTAAEIAGRSPHGGDEVIRLLAALVAAGMLEPVSPAEVVEASMPLTVDMVDDEPERRELPIRWIAAAAAVLVVVLVAAAVAWLRPDTQEPSMQGASWTLVVDMGCQPEELQRVLKKARQHPKDLRPVQADTGEGEPCWRLVWGHFDSREAAEREIASIPSSLVADGFTPHAIELPPDSTESTSD